MKFHEIFTRKNFVGFHGILTLMFWFEIEFEKFFDEIGHIRKLNCIELGCNSNICITFTSFILSQLARKFQFRLIWKLNMILWIGCPNMISRYLILVGKSWETHSNIFPQFQFPVAQTNRWITYPIIGKLNFSVRKTNPGEFLITSFLYNIESWPGPIFGKTFQVQIEA